MSKTVHNARIQLFANLLNTLAGSSLTIGIAAPIAATIYSASTVRPGIIIGAGAVWFALAILLHSLAQSFLGRLRE